MQYITAIYISRAGIYQRRGRHGYGREILPPLRRTAPEIATHSPAGGRTGPRPSHFANRTRRDLTVRFYFCEPSTGHVWASGRSPTFLATRICHLICADCILRSRRINKWTRREKKNKREKEKEKLMTHLTYILTYNWSHRPHVSQIHTSWQCPGSYLCSDKIKLS